MSRFTFTFVIMLALTSQFKQVWAQEQSIANTDSLTAIIDKSDSLTRALQQSGNIDLSDTINNLESRISQSKDSLIAKLTPNTGNNLKAKLDSLKQLQLPPEKYQQKADSLIAANRTKVEQKITDLRSRQEEKLAKGKSLVSDSLGMLNIDQPVINEKLETVTGELPKEELPEMDNLGINDELTESVSEVKEELPTIENPLEEQSAQVKEEVDGLKSQSKEELDPLTAPVKDISEETKEIGAEVKELTGEIGEVSEEVSAAKEGDFTQLEERAGEEVSKHADFDELDKSGLEEQRALIEEKIKLGEQYQDQEFVKQRILEKSKSVSNDVLARYKEKVAQAQLKAAMDHLPKLNNADSLVDFKKKRRKEKRFRDRAFLGLGWEITHDQWTRLDLAPSFGYKIRPSVHLIGSYVYRLRFNADDREVNQNNTIYGPRLGFLLDIWKGFYAKASIDYLRANYSSEMETNNRDWIPGAYVGIGRQYNLTKYFRGDLFGMINLIYDKNESPYQKRLNLRMNFYLDLNKRPPKPEWKNKLKKIKRPKIDRQL